MMHGFFISLETIAAWQVIPPSSVTNAAALFIIGTILGVVIEVISISPSFIFGKSSLGLENNGFIYGGNPMQLGIQMVGIVSVIVFVVAGMGLVFKLINATIGLRAGPEDELRGLDISEHGMESYGGFQIFSTT